MIVIANDHTGLELKNEIKKFFEERGLAYKDIGTNTPERTDYPLWGWRAAKLVASGECERGVIICGTGVGISLAANKVKGIRCVVCTDCYTAQLSRLHNNSNMLALGARVLGTGLARLITEIWLDTPFEGGRHKPRVDMLREIEDGVFQTKFETSQTKFETSQTKA
ncbi:MAG: ribose 5-phosphate isomerase B [Spirochaetaceae bacterium]|jgi:ribose 5-phosphate isomerase B|nr:ribose 5-phosphate isomerase B [Spirochaetaceae bacterium]